MTACESCGAPLKGVAFGGLCPRCMVGGAGTTVRGGFAPEVTPAAELEAALENYEVTGIVGRGGMGVVYRARQRGLDREVALKLLTRGGLDPEFAGRFTREAQITARLDHPSIVPVYEMGYDAEGRGYYTMRLVHGRGLGEIFRMADRGAEGWNLARAAGVVVKVCQAVAYAHGKGVVHRDLKPSNIMAGDLGEVYVMDWGLAKTADGHGTHDIRLRTETSGVSGIDHIAANGPLMTMDGAVVGTPAYMAPEQALGRVEQVDFLSDVYSLGAMLYELLAGHPPYLPTGSSTTPQEVLAAVVKEPPADVRQLRRDVPAELASICEKAMHRDRPRRHATALDMAEDLQAFLDGRVVRAHRTGAWPEFKKWVRRNRALAISAGAAVLAAGAGLTATAIIQTKSAREVSQALTEQKSATQRAEAARAETLLTLADSYASHGQRAGEEGHPGRAQLWFMHAAQTASSDPHRAALNRQRARLWGAEQVRLAGAVGGLRHHVARMQFHPSGRWLLLILRGHGAETLEFPGEMQLLDVERCELVPWGGNSSRVKCAAFEPGADRAAICTQPGTVEVIRLPDLGIHQSIPLPDKSAPVTALAWSADGALLFIGSQPARLWDAKSGRLLDGTIPHDMPACWAVFDPAGTRLITLTPPADAAKLRQGTVRVFALPPGQGEAAPLFSAGTHEVYMDSPLPRFSADGAHFFTLPKLDELVTWKTGDGSVVSRHKAPGGLVGLSPDDRMATTHTALMDAASGAVYAQRQLGRAHFTPDGALVMDSEAYGLLETPSLRLWRALGEHNTHLATAGFSPDGTLAATAERHGPLRLWSLPQRTVWRFLPGAGARAVISPDSRWMMSGGYGSIGESYARSMETRVFSMADGTAGGPPLKPGGIILNAAFSPDSTIAALAASASGERMADNGGSVHLYDWRSGADRYPPRLLPSEPLDIAWSPDGGKLAVLCRNGKVLALTPGDSLPPRELAAMRPAEDPRGSFAEIGDLRFSQDGTALIVRAPDDNDPTIAIIDWPSQKLRGTFPTGGRVNDVAESGGIAGIVRFESIGGEKPSFWRLSDCTPAPSPLHYTYGEYAYHGRFSEDGSLFMMSGQMSHTRIWNWRTGERAVPDLPHINGFAEFVRGQPWIITAGSDAAISTVRLWDRKLGQPAAPPLTLPASVILSHTISPDGRFSVMSGQGRLAGFFVIDIPAWTGAENDSLTGQDQLLPAEINACGTVQRGGFVRLSQGEWMERYQRLSGQRPEIFSTKTPEETLRRWRQTRAIELRAAGHDAAAAWWERPGNE